MTPRSETKERILEEAAHLFHDRGYSGTGISTILGRAEVNSGSLYHFFPGKEALLIGVLERHLARLGPFVLDPAESTTDDPLERIFSLLDFYRRGLLISACTRGCPVGNLALELGDRKPRARRLIDAYFSAWTDRVGAWLAAAGDRLPAELDREALARLVLSVMEGAVMRARAALALDPFDDAVAQLRSHFRLLESVARREPAEGLRDENAPAKPAHEPTSPTIEVIEAIEGPEGTEQADAPGWRYW